jgi:hypothetical protein
MIGIIWILLGVILIGFYNGLLILDDKTSNNDIKNKQIKNKWHFVGAILFMYISFTAAFIWGFKYAPFALSCFWTIFAGIVHIVGLNRPFFFVGTTAKTDILIRKIFPKNPEIGSAILKCLSMVISILLIIFL